MQSISKNAKSMMFVLSSSKNWISLYITVLSSSKNWISLYITAMFSLHLLTVSHFLHFFLGDSHFLIRWPYAFRESEESKAWRWRHRLPAIPVRWRRRRWRWRRQQLCRWIHPVRDRFASWLPEGVWEEPAEWNKEGQWLWQWARSPIVGLFHRTL